MPVSGFPIRRMASAPTTASSSGTKSIQAQRRRLGVVDLRPVLFGRLGRVDRFVGFDRFDRFGGVPAGSFDLGGGHRVGLPTAPSAPPVPRRVKAGGPG